METKTFILTRKKTFRRGVRVFIKDLNGNLISRLLDFSTAHLVPVKERRKRARRIAAEYITNEPLEIEALFRDTAYGKDFTLKGDPSGKLKKKSIVVTADEVEKAAFRGLFKSAKLNFDDSLDIDILREIYRAHSFALSGRDIKETGSMQIPHKEVDVAKGIFETANEARQIYEDKYKEPVPDVVTNDLGFLQALADPDFDAKKYIEKLEIADPGIPDKEKKGDPATEDTVEQLQAKYFNKYKKHPANSKKNDRAWLKAQLKE